MKRDFLVTGCRSTRSRAGVICAHLGNPGSPLAAGLACGYLGWRALYGYFYITDRGGQRSFVWGLSMVTILGLYIVALL